MRKHSDDAYLKIKVKANGIENAIKEWKKALNKSHIIRTLKEKKEPITRGEKKRRDKKAAIKRIRKQNKLPGNKLIRMKETKLKRINK